MKRFILLTVLCCLVLGMSAQTAKEEIFADIHRSAANYYAYPAPTAKLTAPPAGYKPFYLSSYARHGSRFLIDPNDYEKPLEVLREADRDGVLTELGKKTLCVLDSVARMAKGRYGELTPLGARQHKGIAERMYRNFPEIFKEEIKVDARSTVVIRCILSMMSECMQLQALNPKLQFTNDASYHDMYYMNFSDPHAKELRQADEVVAARAAIREEHVHPERLMKALFTNADYVKWKVDAGKLMTLLFDVAGNMQSLDTELELYSLFTKEECYDLWQVSNKNWYITYGPSPLTKGEIPFMEANLLENILNMVDACVVKKENYATLRFGHESCLLPLACLLELDDCAYQTANLDKLDETWRNYNIFPMACNVQFVFYRKKGSGDVLVKVLFNEHEAKLPIESELAPYYKWKDVEQYYRNKLAGYKK
ncbi:MAG: histidine-type phosphatase [Bacteroides sp.]|nr:histidine-type phosphatase [Bacteroides sp.]